MRGFYINRDGDTDRRRTFEARARAVGLSFERVAAVTPSEGDAARAQERPFLRRPRGWTPLTPGEVGCLLSHRRIWRIVVDEGLPWAVVAEDDVHFAETTAALLERLPALAEGADLVKLETYLDDVEIGRTGIRILDEFFLKRLHSKHVGSAGYAISLDGARRLIGHTERYVSPVDLLMFDPDLDTGLDLVVLQLDPACCIQIQRLESCDASQSSVGTAESRSALPRSGRLVLVWKVLREIKRGLAKLRSSARRRAGASELKAVPFRG